MLLLVEINQDTYDAIQLNQYLGCKTMLESIIANGTPIEEGDAISREALKDKMKKAEEQADTYEMLVEFYEQIIDNAPSLEAKVGANNVIIGADIGTSNDIDASRYKAGADK